MANPQVQKANLRLRRRLRIRKKIRGTAGRPRLAVSRSLNHIEVQLIDDTTGRSLLGLSSNSREIRDTLSGNKSQKGREVGRALAAKALEAGIKTVVFDRGGRLYHGRIKALADGAREGGLLF
ncbi:MAG: 50S ribosomal protein L18 [Gemmatimonadetes bacterium]|nr:50S ribosomal protein L18 [Gemmatimonadota bacterium]MDE3257043.1 50S ribosomal protein L18 [Gemmatimonadota bacterium]